jgi:transaldolase
VSLSPPVKYDPSLTRRSASVPKKLEASSAGADKIEKVSYISDETKFRWDLFEDTMAFEKLHEGIRGFAKDGEYRDVVIGEVRY